VLFAMLAGLAPLQEERMRTRGAPSAAVRDPRTFYDTSSYGARAVSAMAAAVGPAQLVYGSDRPVAEPPPIGSLGESPDALVAENPARLLGGVVVFA
jgi:hypothetical protein